MSDILAGNKRLTSVQRSTRLGSRLLPTETLPLTEREGSYSGVDLPLGDGALIDIFPKFREYSPAIQFVMPELDRCATLSTPESSRPALRRP